SGATAPCLTSSGRGVERTGETRGQDPVIAVHVDDAARCDTAGYAQRLDWETENFVATPISFGAQMSVPQVDMDVNQTLQAKNPMVVAYGLSTQQEPKYGENVSPT